MYKSFKFRMYPTKEQVEILNKCFGSIRFIYNHYLTKIKEESYKSTRTYINDYHNNLKHQYPFLQEVDYLLITKTLFTLEDNYKKYTQSNFGYPKYKSKYKKNSYTIKPLSNTKSLSLDLTKKEAVIQELGKIKVRGYRNLKNINGQIINATLSKEKNGKYYISFLYKLPDIPRITPNTIVGLDLGIKKLITQSDSKTYDNNKYINKYEEKIKREQYKLAKKQKGSKNYYKNLKKLNILYTKLANARKYYTHKITKEITDNYDIITTETLNTKAMIENKETHLSKSINDAVFAEIIRQLEYKSKEKGKYFYKVNTYYPSSQTCSTCDHIDKKYKNLNEREYNCKYCHTQIDRDLNASINIMFEGLKLYMKEVYV